MAGYAEKTINNGEFTWAEFMEMYHHGADVTFIYHGREIMLGWHKDAQGRCVRAIQEHIGDDWPAILCAPYGDCDWLLYNFKIDGQSVYEFLPMARVTDT